ncbi:MAG: glycosyltransferase [Oscillospiraceae bacterium]
MGKLYSIIIAHYNQPLFWREAIDSVLCQDYADIELIFADDGSKNFDEKEVEAYINEHKSANIKNTIVIASKRNLGTVKNINNAISASNGEYLQFFAADDALFKNDIITKNVIALEAAEKDVMAVTSMAKKYDENMDKCLGQAFEAALGFRRNKMTASELHDEILVGCVYVASTCCYKKELFGALGLFDERYRLIEDAPYWLKMTKNGYKIKYCNYCSVKYRMGGMSHPVSGIASKTRIEYQGEEVIFLTRDLVPELKDLPIDKQIKGVTIYHYSRDIYCKMAPDKMLGLQDEDLLREVPELEKKSKLKKLDVKVNEWLINAKKALPMLVIIWLCTAVCFVLTLMLRLFWAAIITKIFYEILPVAIIAIAIGIIVLYLIKSIIKRKGVEN